MTGRRSRDARAGRLYGGSLLFGLTSRDPATFAGGALVLVGVGRRGSLFAVCDSAELVH
jgi:hypothetical protein